jgi:legumain
MRNDPLVNGTANANDVCGIARLPPAPTPAPPKPVPVKPTPAPKPANGVAKTWAVIAVGSKGFSNYRHQADACHAYHVLRKSGIAAAHIIVMMQDDVASSEENPFPGQLYNSNGTNYAVSDVHSGCEIDYKGDVVTADLFLNVITGNESGVPQGGKVLKSTSDDRVFLYFVDHGSVGFVSFPNGPPLHVTDLSAALKTMSQKSMFSKLLFYMEACHSGSMFPDLTATGKILAVTAANSEEDSWGTYCPPFDNVKGKEIMTCLGDLFSVSWLEDADRGEFSTESIDEQVETITAATDKSHVQVFGDSSFATEPFGGFALRSPMSKHKWTSGRQRPMDGIQQWPARDIPMQLAYYRATQGDDMKARQVALEEYEDIMADRLEDDLIFRNIVDDICRSSNDRDCFAKLRAPIDTLKGDSHLNCHKKLTSIVFEHCPRRRSHHRVSGGWNAYSMKFGKELANICTHREDMKYSMRELKAILHKECSSTRASDIVV